MNYNQLGQVFPREQAAAIAALMQAQGGQLSQGQLQQVRQAMQAMQGARAHPPRILGVDSSSCPAVLDTTGVSIEDAKNCAAQFPVPIAPDRGFVAEMQKVFCLFQPTDRAKLTNAQYRKQPYTIYAARSVSGAISLDVFTEGDTIVTGTTNLAKAQLEVNQWFICTHVRLTYDNNAASNAAIEGDKIEYTNAAAGTTSYTYMQYPAQLINGLVRFQVDQKVVWNKYTPISRLFTRNANGLLVAETCLEAPVLIAPQKNIDLHFDFSAAMPSTTSNERLRVELIGGLITFGA